LKQFPPFAASIRLGAFGNEFFDASAGIRVIFSAEWLQQKLLSAGRSLRWKVRVTFISAIAKSSKQNERTQELLCV
jgi:hypothetical protein